MIRKWRTTSCVVLLIALLAILPAVAKADTTYNTIPAWNGTSYILPFGSPNTATYGQTFVAPTDNVLTSFTFYLSGAVGTSLDVEADVFAWSGSMTGGSAPQGATGPALYTSPSFVINGTGSFTPVTVITGGVDLTPGQNYIALFTISNPADYGSSIGTMVWGDIYPGHVANDGGGGFNFYNNGSNYAALNTTSWDDYFDGGDSAWEAQFTSVPEPGSLILTFMGLGMIGVLIAIRR